MVFAPVAAAEHALKQGAAVKADILKLKGYCVGSPHLEGFYLYISSIVFMFTPHNTALRDTNPLETQFQANLFLTYIFAYINIAHYKNKVKSLI